MNRAIFRDGWVSCNIIHSAIQTTKALMAGHPEIANGHKIDIVSNATGRAFDMVHYNRIRWNREGHKYCQIIWFLGDYGGTRFTRDELRDVVKSFVGWIDRELNRDTSHDGEIKVITVADILELKDEFDDLSFLRGRLHV